MGEPVGPIEAMDAVKASAVGAVRTLVPAIVESYNPLTHTAVVKFARRSQAADGSVIEPAPTPPLPVAWLNAGGWEARAELEKGDLVDIMVHDRSIGEVLLTGTFVDPENQRRFSFSDAVVVPWLSSSKSPLAAGTAQMVIGRKDGSATIKIGKTGEVEVEGANIKLGLAATLAIARATDPVGFTSLMGTWMSQVAVFINGLAPGTVSPAAPATFGTITSGATKAKAE